MNDRIRELAEQSGFKLIRENCYDIASTMSVQEFAELIVRECIDIVEDAVLRREPASTYVGKIKTHFGVEE